MPGKIASIEHDTTGQEDTESIVVPFNKVFDITRIEITNKANADIMVEGWDTFTDTDEADHTTTALEIKKFAYPVASLDAIVIDCQDKAKRILGTLELRAYTDAGNLISSEKPVIVWVGGEFPF